MGKSSAPQPPDPKETAAASTSTNVGTAIANSFLNNYNQVTPDGTLNFDKTGSYDWNDPYTGKTYNVPTFTATQTLSPEAQAIKDKTGQAQLNLADLASTQSGRVSDLLDKPFDLSKAPEAGTYGMDSRKRIEDALFARMQPQMDRDRSNLEQRLADQGIGYGSKAYGSAMDDLGRNVADTRLATVAAGGQEESRVFDQANAARQQYLNEQFATRNQPINEITALLSGSQVAQPNFVSTKSNTIPTTDVAGIIGDDYKARLGAWQQEQAQTNSIVGGLFGLGSGLIKWSDERLKTDIEEVGETPQGDGVYKFRYRAGGPMQLGLMAQEVERRDPDAVITTKSGFKAVDYGKALHLGAGMREAA